VQVIQQSNFIFLIAFNSSRRTPTISLNLLDGTIDPDTDPYADILVLQMEQILLMSETVALGRLNANTAGSFGSGLVGIDRDGVSATNADGVSISVSPNRLQHRRDLAKFNVEQITEQLNMALKDFRWRIAGGNGRDVSMPRYWHGHYGRGWGGY
jgi:hypothetical protein